MIKGLREPTLPPQPAEGAAPKSEGAQPKPPFELRYTLDAAADIKGLDGSVRNKLRKVLEKKLAIDPEAYGLPLRGSLANYWKHQFGNHRVICRVYRQHRIVVVCAVGARKHGDAEDIYRQLEALTKTGRLAEQLASVLKNLLPNKKV
jgi:mRNA-degrading endonuclease RelE of RelBE toxin-antitoxin system